MLRLEIRPQPSQTMSILSPMLALGLTIGIGYFFFLVLGKDPLRGLQLFLIEPIKNLSALGELSIKATPLLLIALGLAVCYRANVWNIGAEGQFVLGALSGGWVALQAGASRGWRKAAWGRRTRPRSARHGKRRRSTWQRWQSREEKEEREDRGVKK